MQCEYCDKQMPESYSYEVGGVVECSQCFKKRNMTVEDELRARIADLEQELIDQADQHAKILAPTLDRKYRHHGCKIAQRACSSGCPYWGEFSHNIVTHKAPDPV